MRHELHELGDIYDELLMKPDKSPEDEARISQIEACVLERFSYSLVNGCTAENLYAELELANS